MIYRLMLYTMYRGCIVGLASAVYWFSAVLEIETKRQDGNSIFPIECSHVLLTFVKIYDWEEGMGSLHFTWKPHLMKLNLWICSALRKRYFAQVGKLNVAMKNWLIKFKTLLNHVKNHVMNEWMNVSLLYVNAGKIGLRALDYYLTLQ